MTFKKNKWHTKFAAENNFCDVIRSLFRCKYLNNKHIALVIFNGSKLNANRKKTKFEKKEWAFFRHHHITIPMIWLWIFVVHSLFACILTAYRTHFDWMRNKISRLHLFTINPVRLLLCWLKKKFRTFIKDCIASATMWRCCYTIQSYSTTLSALVMRCLGLKLSQWP